MPPCAPQRPRWARKSAPSASSSLVEPGTSAREVGASMSPLTEA